MRRRNINRTTVSEHHAKEAGCVSDDVFSLYQCVSWRVFVKLNGHLDRTWPKPRVLVPAQGNGKHGNWPDEVSQATQGEEGSSSDDLEKKKNRCFRFTPREPRCSGLFSYGLQEAGGSLSAAVNKGTSSCLIIMLRVEDCRDAWRENCFIKCLTVSLSEQSEKMKSC